MELTATSWKPFVDRARESIASTPGIDIEDYTGNKTGMFVIEIGARRLWLDTVFNLWNGQEVPENLSTAMFFAEAVLDMLYEQVSLMIPEDVPELLEWTITILLEKSDEIVISYFAALKQEP